MLLWARIVPLLVALGVQAQERVVDLTPKSESDGRTASQSSWREQVDCRGRSTGRIGPAPTLSLTVARLDRSEVSMGGQFVMDLRVKNIGKAPVVFPSVLTQDFGGRFGLPPYAIEAYLVIVGIDAQGGEHTLSGTVLRGSPGRFGTTESLDPGESLTIRFPGWIVNVDGPSAPVTGDAKLFAMLILRDNECRDWNPVTSLRVNVRFRGRN
jgi:hypothetical protein